MFLVSQSKYSMGERLKTFKRLTLVKEVSEFEKKIHRNHVIV